MKSISADESVQTLLCGIIKIAVEDYRYCSGRGYIRDGKIIPEAIKDSYLIGLNLRASDLPALVGFFWKGGLHTTIEAAGIPMRPSRVLAKLEPDNWMVLLKENYPDCDLSN